MSVDAALASIEGLVGRFTEFSVSDKMTALTLLVGVLTLLVAGYTLVIARSTLVTGDRAARNDVVAQVRDWAGDVVHLLAEARTRCENDPIPARGGLASAHADLAARASALLDRGRFFFPNIQDRYRPPILDLVMLSYKLIPRIHEDPRVNKRVSVAFHYLQIVFMNTVRDATKFFLVPASVKEYEFYLRSVRVQDLPMEIRTLVDQRQQKPHGSQIHFREDIRLDENHLPKRFGPPPSRDF
jgi:hypothetical protein